MINEQILQEIGAMTAVIIKNNATTLTAHGRIEEGESKARGYIVREGGRTLLHTDAEFDTPELAKAHMEEVVKTCVEWGDAGMPKILTGATVTP